MGSRPSASRVTLHCERIDREVIDRAWHLLRSAARRLDRIAKEQGWPTPFAPARGCVAPDRRVPVPEVRRERTTPARPAERG
jgi:hypothetical protein